MNVHKNARLTPAGRAHMVSRVLAGETIDAVADAMGVSPRTVKKWLRRYREEGNEGLLDRSSRPATSPTRTAEALIKRAIALRVGLRLSQRECGKELGVPRSTIGRWLRRAGVGRLRPDRPDEPVRRYERQRPGELLHLDIKRLPRFFAVGHRITGTRAGTPRSYKAGHEYVHVAIDDHTRVAYVEVLPDERATSAVPFLKRAIAWFAKADVTIERLMTDNGACYRSKAFRKATTELGIRHIFTKPYTPKTNGKAERFIQTMLREWARARAYQNHLERTRWLPCWLRFYNHGREHSSLGYRPPASRLPRGNNVMGNYS